MSLFYSVVLVFFWSLWSSSEGITLSAVKKRGAPKYEGEPHNILDLVDIVSGRHADAVAVATFSNSINETG